MKYLVDTHILLWSFLESDRLPNKIRTVLLDMDNAIYYSPVSLWEISIKYGLQILFLNGGTPDDFFEELHNSYYLCKEIENSNVITSYKLPIYHKDPFDRFLVWEAMQNDFTLISADKKMELYTKEGLKVIY
jgi:PIN domain nuclease of toxin-antitoxin system